MSYPQEAALKQAMAGQGLAGTLTQSAMSLKSQLQMELSQAEARVERLKELIGLLEENPKVERIMELLGQRY